jgi:prevent-host-death family protein
MRAILSDRCTYLRERGEGMGTDVDDTVEEHRDAPMDQPSHTTKVGIRELGRNPSKVIAHLVEAGHPVIITDRGRPVAVLTPVDEGEVEDFILAHAEEFVRNRALADAALAVGRTHALTDVIDELDD